jgi:hypothetical protein
VSARARSVISRGTSDLANDGRRFRKFTSASAAKVRITSAAGSAAKVRRTCSRVTPV